MMAMDLQEKYGFYPLKNLKKNGFKELQSLGQHTKKDKWQCNLTD